jgi:hypothetical protein
MFKSIVAAIVQLAPLVICMWFCGADRRKSLWIAGVGLTASGLCSCMAAAFFNVPVHTKRSIFAGELPIDGDLAVRSSLFVAGFGVLLVAFHYLLVHVFRWISGEDEGKGGKADQP